MIFKEMKGSSALGAKRARACDTCLRIRARWFCAADDAFLCHACDKLVHSANQLASRHERVRLQTSCSKVNYSVTPDISNKVSTTSQAWHTGFTRKARTPRHNKSFLVQQQAKDEEEDQEVIFNNNSSSILPLVPELGSEELLLDDETEDQMLCRVPVFDPFDSELGSVYNEVKDEILDTNMKNNDVGADDESTPFDLENFSELLPSDVDLAEFAADVESLLDEDSGDVKGPELVDCKEEDEIDAFVRSKGSTTVRAKDEELDADTDCNLDSIHDTTGEAFDWNIDSESMALAAYEKEEKVPVVASGSDSGKVGTKKKKFLRLNHEEVIAAWASQGSPWTTGNPHKFNFDDCWPDYLGSSGVDVQCSNAEVRSLRGHLIGSVDGGREARVSRYREKRRTRLFAKKIRYEVRKLNAEKRPRMKGRFVKRTSLVGDTAFPAQSPLTSK